jgi:ubiquinone/menaquinone biosynthesis C-methylase UbiE
MSEATEPAPSSLMSLQGQQKQAVTNELAVMQRLLKLDGARVLELGCGAADKTRQLAEQTPVSDIVAVEIDPIQHEKNIRINDLPKVTFKSYGAEEIAEPDASFDIVLMFKSLHHVPEDCLDQALEEIHRVLKPGGQAYFSEPVFAGAFNEIMRLFHDEEQVRQQAFSALQRAVNSPLFDLQEEYFFRNVVRLKSWEQYQHGILNVTHTEHQLSDDVLTEVKKRFTAHQGDEGFVFEIPNRVDVLRRNG